jgi:probable rRNA maturation factor
MADSRAQRSAEDGHSDLDLAFSADPHLPPELVAAAGPWCAPPEAEASWQGLLAGWLEQLQAELPAPLQAQAYSLGLSLVGDSEIADLNSDWRDKPGPTDVLAFAAQDTDLDGAPPMPGDDCLELGDIVISLETAARQAPEHGNSLEQELLFLASHGLLHLLGWDHPDQASLTAMLQRQEGLCTSVNVQVDGSSTGL